MSFTPGEGQVRVGGTELTGGDLARLATTSLAAASRGGRTPACSIVDSSVHVRPRNQAEFREYLPRVWKGRRLPSGDRYYYPNPVGEHLRDSYGEVGPPGSDPGLMNRHLFDGTGTSQAILHPLTLGLLPDIDLLNAICSATNEWLSETWLTQYNGAGRYKGTIRVAPGDPKAAVAEIEKWADHPHFVQVGVPMQSLQTYGKRVFWPVWEAAAHHGLPVAVHADAETGVEFPPTPAGYLHSFFGFSSLQPLTFINHLISLMVEGVFDHLPSLRMVFADGGFDVLGPMMWRLDKDYRPMRVDMPWMKRLPSDYLADHVRFVTHQMDGPAETEVASEWLPMVDGDSLLIYGSNYPSWDFLAPSLVYPDSEPAVRERILCRNAMDLYRLSGGDSERPRDPEAGRGGATCTATTR